MAVDDEIRSAFEALADRAPHPARVQQALARAARAHRQRRALLLAGGLAAGTAAVTGAGLAAGRWARRGSDAPPGGPTTPPDTTPPTTTTAGNLLVPMAYRMGRLPAGLVERVRRISLSEPVVQERSWNDRTDHQPIRRQLELVVGPGVPPEYDSAAAADVNGARGRVWGDAAEATIAWPTDDGRYLRLWVSGFGDNAATARELARSVEPDGVSTLEVPYFFRWYPSMPVAQVFTYSYYSQSLTATSRDLSVGTIRIRRGVPEPERDEPVTVRGLSGAWTRADEYVAITVTLTDGRTLDAILNRGGGLELSDQDALRVVEELHVGPEPAYEWYGR